MYKLSGSIIGALHFFPSQEVRIIKRYGIGYSLLAYINPR